MNPGKGLPMNAEMEASLLGALVLRPAIVTDVIGQVDSSDFLAPNNRRVFESVRELHLHGKPIDVVTVADQMHMTWEGDWLSMLMELTNATPAVSNWKRYADVVVDNGRRRAVIGRLAELTQDAYGYQNPIDEVIAQAAGITGEYLIASRGGEIAGLYTAAEIREVDALENDLEHKPWLIPHILKAGWRIILVAAEGIGKAVLMRFLGIHVACGRNPWHPTQFIEPRRVTYVDTENEAETVVHQIRIANRTEGTDLFKEAEDRFMVWHREGGLDLRNRRTLAEFEAVLQQTRPEILLAGPLYKLYRRHKNEDMEQAALEFTEILDDLRVRYGFALILEHHAPKAVGGALRDLNPFGSSLFMRWPVIGLTLAFDQPTPHDAIDYRLNIGRFRRDRVLNDWPQAIDRDSHSRYAFTPLWAQGEGEKLRLAEQQGL